MRMTNETWKMVFFWNIRQIPMNSSQVICIFVFWTFLQKTFFVCPNTHSIWFEKNNAMHSSDAYVSFSFLSVAFKIHFLIQQQTAFNRITKRDKKLMRFLSFLTAQSEHLFRNYQCFVCASIGNRINNSWCNRSLVILNSFVDNSWSKLKENVENLVGRCCCLLRTGTYYFSILCVFYCTESQCGVEVDN